MKPFLVVNPRSAGGWTGRNVERILGAVRAAVGEVDWAFTREVGDGARLAREAYRLGRRLVVAVGGDGTASEVIDGVASAGGLGDPGLAVGVIPNGTGGDLRRSLGLPDDLAGAAAALAAPGAAVIDVGRAELARPDGSRVVRHFANVATCGVSALVAAHVNRGRRFGSGRLTFFLASARAMLGWSDRPIRWRADGGPWTEERITAFSCCNGRYFGGGMKVAPDARVDDGLFDLVIWKGYGPIDLAVKRPMIYDGRHVHLPGTRVLRAREVEVEPVGPEAVLVDLDGEQPGLLPVRLELLPKALRVKGGRP